MRNSTTSSSLHHHHRTRQSKMMRISKAYVVESNGASGSGAGSGTASVSMIGAGAVGDQLVPATATTNRHSEARLR
jgi:hypothetical protein